MQQFWDSRFGVWAPGLEFVVAKPTPCTKSNLWWLIKALCQMLIWRNLGSQKAAKSQWHLTTTSHPNRARALFRVSLIPNTKKKKTKQLMSWRGWTRGLQWPSVLQGQGFCNGGNGPVTRCHDEPMSERCERQLGGENSLKTPTLYVFFGWIQWLNTMKAFPEDWFLWIRKSRCWVPVWPVCFRGRFWEFGVSTGLAVLQTQMGGLNSTLEFLSAKV